MRKGNYMTKFYKFNEKLANECLRNIEYYRGVKENNEFDIFYHSHLDFMESLINDYLALKNNYVGVIQRSDGWYLETQEEKEYTFGDDISKALKFPLDEDIDYKASDLRRLNKDYSYNIILVKK